MVISDQDIREPAREETQVIRVSGLGEVSGFLEVRVGVRTSERRAGRRHIRGQTGTKPATFACLIRGKAISEPAQDTYRGRASGLGGGDSGQSAIINWPQLLRPHLTTTTDINDG